MRHGLRGRGEELVAAAVFVAVLAPLIQFRFGYQAGSNDHLVLSLQGLQWGRPGFLVGDWFLASAPQPHILFDLVTWAGVATGTLAEVYVGWWLLGLVVGGAATGVLARAWTPRHPLIATAAVAAVIGLGPQLVLGTTTPALPTALPHQLGGFLAYLAAALLLTRRPVGGGAALIATSLVHVQIGAMAAVVGALAVLVVRLLERQWWWWTLAGVVGAGVVVVTVLRLRPVAAERDDFVEICREVIPYHCDASTWPPGQLGSGLAVVLAALLSVAFVVRTGRTEVGLWLVAVLVPAVGLVGGVLANRYDVPVLGRLAQSTNIFRLAVLLMPFGAWGLVAGFVRLSGWLRIVWLVPALAAGYGWLVVTEGTPPLPDAPGWGLTVLALAAAGVVLRGLPRGVGVVAAAVGGATALAVLTIGAVELGAMRWRPVDITFVADPAMRAVGDAIARHVPVGDDILVPPTLGVVRLTSGRSIVVDCKAVPYGGAAWREYRERLAALGGRDSCHSGGRPFLLVPPEALSATALRYGARYLLLTEWDPRVRPVRELGWRPLMTPDVRTGRVWLLAAPGAPDAVFSPWPPARSP